MQKVNALFHKRVIDQSSGDAVATVRDVVLSADGQRIVALIINGGDRSRDDKVIRWDAVVSVGEYVVVDGARTPSELNEDPEVAELRQDAQQITGKAVMSTTGERLGTVSDMLFDMSGELVGYELKQGLFGGKQDTPIVPAAHVQAIGKDAIIVDSIDIMSSQAIKESPEERAVGRENAARPITQPLPPVGDERQLGDPHTPTADRPSTPDVPFVDDHLEGERPSEAYSGEQND